MLEAYAPITSEVGLIEKPLDEVVSAFKRWQDQFLAQRNNILEVVSEFQGLEGGLRALAPLTSIESRFLFSETQSAWTAYFDNANRGTDAFPVASYLAQMLDCRGLKAVHVPHTFLNGLGKYGAFAFELYGPKPTDFLNYVRSVALINDGGKWVFTQNGNPLPGEDSSSYSDRLVKNRFSYELLRKLLRLVDADPFEEKFYGRRSTLLERRGLAVPGMMEYDLQDVREKS
jgi:hypothetical protein